MPAASQGMVVCSAQQLAVPRGHLCMGMRALDLMGGKYRRSSEGKHVDASGCRNVNPFRLFSWLHS